MPSAAEIFNDKLSSSNFQLKTTQPVLTIIKRELQRIVRQPIYLFSMVVAPLFCCLLFTTLMGEGLPEQLPAGVVDEDATATSRNVRENLGAFQMVDIRQVYANVGEARRAMQRGDIYGFYLLPKGMENEALRQRIPTVSFYTNSSFLVAGSLLYRDMRMMSELASGAATRSVLYAKGATERQAMAYLQPVVVDMHPLGNAVLNYNVYLTNLLIPGVLGIFIFMMTVYTFGTELKFGTARQLMRRSGGSGTAAVFGKLWAQFGVFLLTGTAVVLWLYGALHFPRAGGLPRMWGLMALYILACQGLGLAFFTLLPTLRLGLSTASLWGVLSFSICGMSFPVMAMHPTLQGVAWLFPLRHYYVLYVCTALHGFPLGSLPWHVVVLWLFAALPLLCLRRLKGVMLHGHYEA